MTNKLNGVETLAFLPELRWPEEPPAKKRRQPSKPPAIDSDHGPTHGDGSTGRRRAVESYTSQSTIGDFVAPEFLQRTTCCIVFVSTRKPVHPGNRTLFVHIIINHYDCPFCWVPMNISCEQAFQEGANILAITVYWNDPFSFPLKRIIIQWLPFQHMFMRI